ncbi:MAG: hypothetical protein AB1608_09465 [Thermoproteota archaeon]
MVSHFNAVMISITATMLLLLAFAVTNKNASSLDQDQSTYAASKLPELKYYQNYDELKADEKTAVIYPVFTQGAYEWGGIHDYLAGYCDSCLASQIPIQYEKTYSASGNGFRILEFLGYQVIDDADIDKEPQILDQFDKVVVLHNEFVTKKEFEAITTHPKVIYLYPNALSSEVTADYSKNTITLKRGPSYPDPSIKNGFDWKYDNTQFFSDWDCNSWEFYQVSNGYMLNCYPETFLPSDGYKLLKTLKNL